MNWIGLDRKFPDSNEYDHYPHIGQKQFWTMFGYEFKAIGPNLIIILASILQWFCSDEDSNISPYGLRAKELESDDSGEEAVVRHGVEKQIEKNKKTIDSQNNDELSDDDKNVKTKVSINEEGKPKDLVFSHKSTSSSPSHITSPAADEDFFELNKMLSFSSVNQIIKECGGEFLFYIGMLCNLIACCKYLSLLSVIELLILGYYSFKRWRNIKINTYLIILAVLITYQYIREIGIPPIGDADGWIMWPWMNNNPDYQYKFAFGGFTLTRTFWDVLAIAFLAMSRVVRNVFIYNIF